MYSRAQWGLWNEGQVTRRENGSAEFTPVSGGVIDSGLSYAVTSFVDTKNNASRRIQWGWANEENNNFGLLQAGYQGAMSTSIFYIDYSVIYINSIQPYPEKCMLSSNEDLSTQTVA